jgi:hypothetical protein
MRLHSTLLATAHEGTKDTKKTEVVAQKSGKPRNAFDWPAREARRPRRGSRRNETRQKQAPLDPWGLVFVGSHSDVSQSNAQAFVFFVPSCAVARGVP